MPIAKPTRVLLHHVPLKFIHTRVAGGGKKAVDAGIVLVPFIDFLLTLVVFLLSLFGNQVVAQDDKLMEIPSGVHTTELEEAPVISINRNFVALDGVKVADTAVLAEKDELDPMENMVNELNSQKLFWEKIHAGQEFPGLVIVLADQEVSFKVIKKVLASTAIAQYANVSFAVNKVGE